MLKTISAALLAVSVIAAPAFATEAAKTTTTAPVIKAEQSKTKVSSTVKADAKTTDIKAKAMNANAAIGPDEHKVVRTHRHHHKHLSARKSLKAHPHFTKRIVPASPVKKS